ncbi:lysozyme inhibitor LprI family protein [Salmonella enterica]|nr:lysozyme inhibitor LprI family protein [Salmonella enterica]
MKRIFLTCAALLFSSQALADECASASTQLEMNRCAAAQYQAADKKLNETYQSAIKRAQPPQRELLQKAQVAWIALRDADCALIRSGTEGGSIQPMIASQCLTDKTNEREAFLASLLQCEEGDLSCPLPPAG